MELPKMSPVSDSEPPAQAQGTSGMAVASLILGITSIFPLIGVLLGLLAIILGIIGISETGPGRRGGRGMAVAGTILGVLGIAVTVAIYGTMFYLMSQKSGGEDGGFFLKMKIDGTQQMLVQAAGALELYNKSHGQYPEDLKELRDRRNGGVPGMDMFQQPLVYRLSEGGKSYVLYSRGPDGKDGTKDDIQLPGVPPPQRPEQ